MLFKRVFQFSAAILATVAACAANALVEDHYSLDIPSQKLSSALLQLGKQTGLSIVIPANLVSHQESTPINGEMAANHALTQLLQNTQLTFKVITPSVVTIISRPAPQTETVNLPIHYEEVSIIGTQVTGSRILRSDLQGASPIDIITSVELERSGAQSLSDILKFVPAVSGNSTSTAVSNGGDGTATITLRGLPANNTLVLINGQRVAFDGLAGDSVDLNTISPHNIERIEILKDGASAIYGADAIAGVVNIITKQDYDGFLFDQYYGQSSKKDVETVNTHMQWGLNLENGGFIVSANYYKQNGLFSRDRELSASADGRSLGGIDSRTSATGSSRITLNDGHTVILDELARPPVNGSVPEHFRLATDEDLFDHHTQTSSISPSERGSLFFAGNYDFTPDLNFRLDASYSETQAKITLASTPIYTAFLENPITVAADNIYNPFDQEIEDIRRRVLELPPREQHNTSDNTRVVLSLEGMTAGVNWDTHVFWNRTRAEETLSGLVDGKRVEQAIGPAANCQGIEIDGCEPLNLFGPSLSMSAEQVSFIETQNQSEGHSTLSGFNLNADLALATTAAGTLFMATGLEFREESSSLTPVLDEGESQENVIGGVLTNPTEGSRNIAETYVELQAPLVHNLKGVYSLDLEAAIRYSHYSDFGTNTAPKVGLRYRPIAELLMRSTYSEGFRAPSIDELYKEGFQTQAFLTDPCSVADNVSVLPGCSQQSDPTRTQFLTEFSGAKNLKAEQSQNATFGFYWTPYAIPGLSLSGDWFWIDQSNVVDADPQTIVDQNALGNDFGSLVNRNDSGNITKVFAPFINIGTRTIRGLDVTANYKIPASPIQLSFNASHINQYLVQLNDNSELRDIAGTFSDAATEGDGAIPKWKANAGIHATLKQHDFSYSVHYVDSMQEELRDTANSRTIQSWTTHDVQYAYFWRHSLKLTLGIDNIFDTSPPFVGSAFSDNYDPRTYDIKGRFWYFDIAKSF